MNFFCLLFCVRCSLLQWTLWILKKILNDDNGTGTRLFRFIFHVFVLVPHSAALACFLPTDDPIFYSLQRRIHSRCRHLYHWHFNESKKRILFLWWWCATSTLFSPQFTATIFLYFFFPHSSLMWYAK
jgi:hypothetical protein